jgi:hypothetical protein
MRDALHFMTLSKDARQENRELALTILLGELGSRACESAFFTINEPPFSQILSTTWKLLTDAGLVRSIHPFIYSLTGRGWLEGIRITDQITDSLRADVGRIMSSLKRHVDGRHEPAYVSFFSTEQDARVAPDLLFNVIESRFIENVFRRRGAYWHDRGQGQVILVPIDFGHPR